MCNFLNSVVKLLDLLMLSSFIFSLRIYEFSEYLSFLFCWHRVPQRRIARWCNMDRFCPVERHICRRSYFVSVDIWNGKRNLKKFIVQLISFNGRSTVYSLFFTLLYIPLQTKPSIDWLGTWNSLKTCTFVLSHYWLAVVPIIFARHVNFSSVGLKIFLSLELQMLEFAIIYSHTHPAPAPPSHTYSNE